MLYCRQTAAPTTVIPHKSSLIYAQQLLNSIYAQRNLIFIFFAKFALFPDLNFVCSNKLFSTDAGYEWAQNAQDSVRVIDIFAIYGGKDHSAPL